MKGWKTFFKSKKRMVTSPANGMLLELEKVKDSVFAEKVLGDGIAITPEDGKIHAPLSGSVEALFPTGHAIAIAGDNEIDILIHIGIDTAEIKEFIFKTHVAQGEIVKEGQLLISYDLQRIKELGYDTSVMVIITNQQEGKSFEKREIGPIQVKEDLLWFR